MDERKLGLRPARPDQITRRLALAPYLAALPDPPEECDFSGSIPATGWGMFLNNHLGICGPAAMFHGVQSRIAVLRKKVVLPTNDELTSLYSAAGGYVPGESWTDGGVSNPDMLKVLQSQGITYAGQQITFGPYATCTGDDALTVKKAIFWMEGALFGINLPNSWYNSYGPGNVWDATRSGMEGGHDIHAYGYNATGPLIVTWGQATQMTWAGCSQNVTDCNGIADPTDTIDPATGLTAQGIPLSQWGQDVLSLTGKNPLAPRAVATA